jgi:hypothetical protein
MREDDERCLFTMKIKLKYNKKVENIIAKQ